MQTDAPQQREHGLACGCAFSGHGSAGHCVWLYRESRSTTHARGQSVLKTPDYRLYPQTGCAHLHSADLQAPCYREAMPGGSKTLRITLLPVYTTTTLLYPQTDLTAERRQI